VAETGRLYRETRQRITELVRELPESEAASPVPACPEWTVHDVVAHLAGVVDDALNGRLDGIATEPWTAAQVAKRKDDTLEEIVAEWSQLAPQFEQLPLPFQAVADVASHEQDLRGAVGRPGFRDNEAIQFLVPLLVDHLVERTATHGMPPLELVVGEHSVLGGADNDGELVRLEAEPFEFFRAVFGRRSWAQLEAMAWSGGDHRAILRELVLFGPAAQDVVE
jgi:uncharacterized protein (TIGR03083 family)